MNATSTVHAPALVSPALLSPAPPSVPHLEARAEVRTPDDALHLLRFAASFRWADLAIDARERAFLTSLADELGVPDARAVTEGLLAAPPPPEIVDPSRVRPELAHAVRRVALRAIAADGRVAEREMDLFHVLDELLPDHAAA